MDNLVIKSKKGNPITASIWVAKKFDKEHRHVLDSIREILTAENSAVKFFHETKYTTRRGRKYPCYAMTRDGFSLLAMGFTGKKAMKFKMEFINAFNEMEEKINQMMAQLPDFNNPVEAARAWADEKEKTQIAESEIKALAPKVDFADRVIDSEDNHLVDIGQAAKLLKIPKVGRNIFFGKLRNDGILFMNRNEPKQQYINQGYFELREKKIERENHESFVVNKVLVTQKGLFWLSKKYGGEFKEGIPLLKVE